MLIHEHDNCLKSINWNATNSQYAFKQHSISYYCYISYLLSNVLLFNAVLSLHNVLPKDLQDMRFVDCDILKPHSISHLMKYASFSAVETLACNSQIHYVTLK